MVTRFQLNSIKLIVKLQGSHMNIKQLQLLVCDGPGLTIMSRHSKKPIRYLLIKLVSSLILILILLAILTIVGLHYFLSSGKVKDILINRAEHITGRQVTIKTIRWSILPTPHLELNGIKLSNPQGFQRDHMVTAEHAAIGIEIWPLFHHNLVISKAKADGIKAYLVKNNQGQNNWQFNSQTTTQSSTTNTNQSTSSNTSNSQHTKDNAQGNNPINGLTIHIPNLRLRNANIHYINRNTGQTISLYGIQFEALHIKPHHNFPTQLNMGLNYNGAKWAINYNGQIELSKRFQFIQVNNGHLLIKPERTDIPGITFKALRAQIKWQQPQLLLPNLSTRVAQGKVTANGKVSFDSPQQSKLNVQIKHIDLHKLLMGLLNYNELKGKAYLKTNLSSQGLQTTQLLKHLNGQGNIKAKQVQWHNLNIGKIYNQGLKVLQQNNLFTDIKHHAVSEKPGKLSANYKIKGGRMTTDDLKFVTTGMRLKGQGHINLVNQHLKLNIGIVGMHNNDSYGPKIPIILSGSLNQINIQPDVHKIAQRYLKQGSQTIKKQLKSLQDGDINLKKTITNFLPN